MSFGVCACPLPAAVTTIPTLSCEENFFQIQRFIIARKQTAPAFALIANAALEANWTPLLTAVDGTKHQFTPYVESVVIPQGQPILEGGDDNTTRDGNPVVVGGSQIRATGLFRGLTGAVLSALKDYNCETSLMIYFVNELGKIIGREDPLTAGSFTGFPISAFFIGDPGNEGKNTNDKAPVGFNLRYGWRDDVKFVTPTDFDALTIANS